jgi:hypothetical protein
MFRNTIITLLAIVALGGLSACASTHMKQYMGQDIQEVMIYSGPPINAFDMSDGRRAFQFRWGGGTFTTPQTTTTTGNASLIGNSAWFQANSITSGGNTVTSKGCIITYLTHWDTDRNTWIVSEYRIPKQLLC